MDYLIEPGGRLRGELRLPGDKSISHRAAMLSAVADGESCVSGFLAGEDTLATLAALRALGASIDAQPGEGCDLALRIAGRGLRGLRAPSGPLMLGNSGTAMRLFAGLLSGQPFSSELTGDESLSRRPMGRVIEPLRAMGGRVEARGECAPLRVGGSKLSGVSWRMPIASAQVKSCLLLAGLFAEGKTAVEEPHETRDHSERMLEGFGVRVERRGLRLEMDGGQQPRARSLRVPGDFSSAMFLIVGSCIAPGSQLLLKDVGVNPTRTAALDVLRAMGADIEVRHGRDACGEEPVADISVRAAELRGVDMDERTVVGAIDEIPSLLVAAACARGRTRLRGAAELRVKESDRLAAMARGLEGLGARVRELPDGMDVEGGGLRGGLVDSHGDHRVAMALAIAGLRSSEPVRVNDCANVATSFPNFAALAGEAGLKLKVQ